MRRFALAAAALAALLAPLPAEARPELGARAQPTGRWLVELEDRAQARSSASVRALLSHAGARNAGRGVPRLGLITVRGPEPAIRALRRSPRVASVSREWARPLRRVANDPALSTRETAYGGLPGGAPIQWSLRRQGFYRAWDLSTGLGSRVAVLDTGIDGGHPELAGKILTADAINASAPRRDDEGHGTHVAGLACAATGNGVGVAGAGWGCRLHVVKLGTTVAGSIRDEDIVDAIRLATDRGAHAINMSFGGGAPNAALDLAINYAFRRGVVLVAAADNAPVQDQGAPASQLQPGDAPNLGAGRGLVVTAAEFSGRRAQSDDGSDGVGYGRQVSMAAFGFYDWEELPPGLISTYPGNSAAGDGDCGLVILVCRRRTLGGDRRYAYLEGTSMAVPPVAAAAALLQDLNPWMTLREKLTILKQSASLPGWSSQLGWGILNAGAALEAARRIDRLAPISKARPRKKRVRTRRGRKRVRFRTQRHFRIKRGHKRLRFRIRWRGHDPRGRNNLIPAGVRSYDLYMKRGRGRYRRVRKNKRRRLAVLRLRPGRYRFYTRARDRAGNREAKPRRADVRIRVRKARKRRR